jgi:hypothetical protein
MDLIDDDKLSGLRSEESVRVAQATLIHGALEIEIESRGSRLTRSNITRKRSLADLARAKQDHGGHLFEAILDVWAQAAGNHN